LGKYYEAIKDIDKALSIRPNYATALDNKNKILGLLGKQ
jgi:tetratricopeptide (TPR) repeat protein